MNFEIAYCTEVGCRKSVNQDSLYIKQIRLEEKNILLAVICDGMGGLAQGELASATETIKERKMAKILYGYKDGREDK